jgi:hypothetical protein
MTDVRAMAWERLARDAASLGVAFARFKLSLDDYCAITGKPLVYEEPDPAQVARAALGEDA